MDHRLGFSVASNGNGLPAHNHAFQRDRSVNTPSLPQDISSNSNSKGCSICCGKWDELASDGGIAKYYTCDACGVTCHSSCRGVARTCVPCDPQSADAGSRQPWTVELSDADVNIIMLSQGRIYVKILQVYEVSNITNKTSLYGIAKLHKNSDEFLRSDIKQSQNSDCIWSKVYANYDSSLSCSNECEEFCDDDPSLIRSFHVSQSDDAMADCIHIEIWRSIMTIFDNIAAVCAISLTPLLMRPDSTMERWFDLEDIEGRPSGTVLLRLAFRPFAAEEELLESPRKARERAMLARERGKTALPSTGLLASINTLALQLATPDDSPPLQRVGSGSAPSSSSVIGEDDKEEKKDDDDDDDDDDDRAYVDRVPAPIAAAVSAPLPAAPLLLPAFLSLASVGESLNKLALDLATVEENPSGTLGEELLEPFAIQERDAELAVASSAESEGDEKGREQEPAPTLAGDQEPVPAPIVAVAADDDAAEEPGAAAIPAPASTPSRPAIASSISRWAQGIAQVTMESLIFEGSNPGAGPLQIGSRMDEDEDEASPQPEPAAPAQPPPSAQAAAPSFARESLESGAKLYSGVGRIFVDLASATKTLVADAADGDHYVLVTVDDSSQEARSQRIASSATPVFNRRWVFIAPHYRAVLKLYLVDASTDRRVAVASTSPFALMQRDADRRGSAAGYEDITMTDVGTGEEVGFFAARIRFEEDVSGFFFSSTPRLAPGSPEETLSVERLAQHIDRFKAIIALFNRCYAEYCYIMDWEDILLTSTLFIAFLAATLCIDAEYALCCPMFVMVALMTRSLQRRRSGAFRRQWVEKGVAKQVPLYKIPPDDAN